LVRPLVILGPTASGKSEVAMAWCGLHQPSQIIAVDSMQVYRGMDIGTAKPTAADRHATPHHCLDLADPSEEFAVTQYLVAAHAAEDAIRAEGAQAVYVGGTGLYLRSLLDRLEAPGQFPGIRGELEGRLARGVAIAELHAELAVLDPLAASRMEPTNVRRVVRALEVTVGSGKPFSSFGPGLQQYPPIDAVQVGLRWRRPALAKRIDLRVQRMMAAGLVGEVERLLGSPDGLSRTARQALGYKEMIAALEGHHSIDQAAADVQLRTRQFAVRQERWFRRDPRIRWVDINDDPVAETLPVLEAICRS
jgi:tRNA dimethylallyltransferase